MFNPLYNPGLLNVDITNPVNRGWGPNRGTVGWWSPLPQFAGIGKWLDISGHGNHGTLTNFADIPGAWQPGANGNGRGVLFDGADDEVQLGSIASGHSLMLNGTDATFATWLKPTLTGDNYQRLVDKSDGPSGTNGYCCYVDTNGTISVDVAASSEIISNASQIVADTWQHLAWIHRVSGTPQMFVNGTEISYATQTGRTIPNATANMKFGSWNHSTGRELNGNLTDSRIHNVALTPNEIWQQYEDGLKGYPEAFNYLTHRTTVLFGGDVVETATLSPVACSLSAPTISAPHHLNGTTTPVGVSVTVPAVTAELHLTASNTPVGIAASVPATTAQVTLEAANTPVGMTCAIPAMTAGVTLQATNVPVAVTVTPVAVTAEVTLEAAVSPVAMTVTPVTVAAAVYGGYTATVLPVSLQLNLPVLAAVVNETDPYNDGAFAWTGLSGESGMVQQLE